MRAGVASFCIGTLALLGVVASSHGQGIIAPECRADQQRDGRRLDGGPGRFRRQLLEPGDPQRPDEQGVLARLRSGCSPASTCRARCRPARSAVSSRRRTGSARRGAIAAWPPDLATGVSFRLSDDSPLTLGLGVFGLVGGGVNFAGSYHDADPHAPPTAELLRLRADLREHLAPGDQRRWPRCRSPTGWPSAAGR